MKALNYSDFMWRQKKSYQEIFDENPELYIEPDEWDIQKERMPFGKYTGMTFHDLFSYDYEYFQYMKTQILNEKASDNLNTYNQRLKMLRIMFAVERNNKLEKVGEEYERRKRQSAAS